MASKTMKDIQSAIDSAIDDDDNETYAATHAAAPPMSREGSSGPSDDTNDYGNTSSQRGGSSGRGTYGVPGTDEGLESQGTAGRGNLNVSPIVAALDHNKSGNASPQEMALLQQLMQAGGSTGPGMSQQGQGDSDRGWTMPGQFDPREDGSSPR